MAEQSLQHWDLFCRVIDNFGDAGVCWRLARQLSAEHHVRVRLWIDDLAPLVAIQPEVNGESLEQSCVGIEICQWPTVFPNAEVADVVIEAFACDLPAPYLAAMEAHGKPIAWFNLEYLSAEDWVSGCHGLPSYRSGGQLKKQFFFPGFTSDTGGLLREADLHERRDHATAPSQKEDNARWLRDLAGTQSIAADAITVFFFTYDHAPLPALLSHWHELQSPVNVLLAPGGAQRLAARWRSEKTATDPDCLLNSRVNLIELPLVPQTDFDRLLWLADVCFVRGEDSFVRAQWAAKPFVWQIYPQTENAHAVKLNAFLDRYLSHSSNPQPIRELWEAWNTPDGMVSGEFTDADVGSAWQNFEKNLDSVASHARQWAGQLDQAGNLANNLVCAAKAFLGSVHL